MTAVNPACVDSEGDVDVKKTDREDASYTIGTTIDSAVDIEPFSEEKSDFCDETDIVYTLSVEPANIG